MKKLFVILLVSIMSSCCDVTMCKFKEGDDIEIKNKTFHDEAVVTEIHCGCEYTIAYFSTLGTRRHRLVTEYEIEKD